MATKKKAPAKKPAAKPKPVVKKKAALKKKQPKETFPTEEEEFDFIKFLQALQQEDDKSVEDAKEEPVPAVEEPVKEELKQEVVESVASRFWSRAAGYIVSVVLFPIVTFFLHQVMLLVERNVEEEYRFYILITVASMLVLPVAYVLKTILKLLQ